MALSLRRGKAKAYFLPAVASATLAPTVAEITAGTDLTNKVGELTGFNSKSSTVDVPNLGSRQTPKIPGEKQSDDSTMKFYEDETSNPLRTALAQDVNGYIMLAPFGEIEAGDKVDVFPVTVSSNTREYTMGNEAAAYNVDFTISSVVAQDVAIIA